MTGNDKVAVTEYLHRRTRNLFLIARAVWRFDALVEGWKAGKRARPLFGIDWTTQWQRPIEDVRRELDLPERVDAGVGIVRLAA